MVLICISAEEGIRVGYQRDHIVPDPLLHPFGVESLHILGADGGELIPGRALITQLVHVVIQITGMPRLGHHLESLFVLLLQFAAIPCVQVGIVVLLLLGDGIGK